jgi:hypothetical protein
MTVKLKTNKDICNNQDLLPGPRLGWTVSFICSRGLCSQSCLELPLGSLGLYSVPMYSKRFPKGQGIFFLCEGDLSHLLLRLENLLIISLYRLRTSGSKPFYLPSLLLTIIQPLSPLFIKYLHVNLLSLKKFLGFIFEHCHNIVIRREFLTIDIVHYFWE